MGRMPWVPFAPLNKSLPEVIAGIPDYALQRIIQNPGHTSMRPPTVASQYSRYGYRPAKLFRLRSSDDAVPGTDSFAVTAYYITWLAFDVLRQAVHILSPPLRNG